MTRRLLSAMTLCGACLVGTALAQTSPGTAPGTAATPSTNTYYGGARSSQFDRTGQGSFSATGRFGGEVRGSKLMGSEVKSSTGDNLGTINDIILNPASGRIDFAILSLNETGTTGFSSSTSTTTSTTTSTATGTTTPGTTSTTTPGSISSSTTATTAGKLVPVPWMLLRQYGGTTASTTTSSLEQVAFTFSGDKSKLIAAPSFDQSNWPDISGQEWRRSVFSHYGMTPGSATGGSSTYPGGTSTGSSSSTTPGTSTINPDNSSSTAPPPK